MEGLTAIRRTLFFSLAISLWLFPITGALARDLTFEDRVEVQAAIERVGYRQSPHHQRPTLWLGRLPQS